ncbi:MAG: hypothetical protein SWX82_15010 [Cyanobacteriota bacterium]|nr:hypothetical protein [Cyanobacteriota bacterium]
MGRWGDGEMGGWGDGGMGRWGDGEMGRWGDGEIEKYLVMVEDGTFFTFDIRSQIGELSDWRRTEVIFVTGI